MVEDVISLVSAQGQSLTNVGNSEKPVLYKCVGIRSGSTYKQDNVFSKYMVICPANNRAYLSANLIKGLKCPLCVIFGGYDPKSLMEVGTQTQAHLFHS